MKKNDELKNTMASVFTQEPAKEQKPDTGEPQAKRRRKSVIEKEPLPELPKPKRTRRKKDPALRKTHTMTILVTETLYQRFKAVAEQQEISMNGIITKLLKKYVMTHELIDIDLDKMD